MKKLFIALLALPCITTPSSDTSQKATVRIALNLDNSRLCPFSPEKLDACVKKNKALLTPWEQAWSLQLAVLSGMPIAVKTLIRNNFHAHVDTDDNVTKDQYAQAVVTACNKPNLSMEDLEIISLLLTYKLPVNRVARSESDPLRIEYDLPLTALIKQSPVPTQNHLIVAHLLVHAGASVNDLHRTNACPVTSLKRPLHALSHMSDFGWFEFLLSHGADPQLANDKAQLPVTQLVPKYKAQLKQKYQTASQHPPELGTIVADYLL